MGDAAELLDLIRAGDTLNVERRRRRLRGLRSARRAVVRELEQLDAEIARDVLVIEGVALSDLAPGAPS